MNAAEDRARRAMVHQALELLLSAKPMTRTDLFGDTSDKNLRQFQRRVITNLVEQGVVARQDGEDPNSLAVVVKLKDRRRLEKILSDDVELSRVIWPGTVPTVTDAPPREELQQKEDEVEPQAPQQREVSGAPLPAPVQFQPTVSSEGMDRDEMIAQLLVVMNAACQSIIYMRDKIDRLEKLIDTDLGPKIREDHELLEKLK